MSDQKRAGWPVIPALDGFRAYALLGVVGFHMLTLSATPSERGGEFGVLVWGAAGGLLDIFFIVSGCALFLPVVMHGGLRTGGDTRANGPPASSPRTGPPSS